MVSPHFDRNACVVCSRLSMNESYTGPKKTREFIKIQYLFLLIFLYDGYYIIDDLIFCINS